MYSLSFPAGHPERLEARPVGEYVGMGAPPVVDVGVEVRYLEEDHEKLPFDVGCGACEDAESVKLGRNEIGELLKLAVEQKASWIAPNMPRSCHRGYL